MSMKHLCMVVRLEFAKIKSILAKAFVWVFICVVPNLKTVQSEGSNSFQVLREFCILKNSFHVSPKVLIPYFESPEIAR